ncbi:MAG: RNA polymerase sigma factor [Fimbriimonadaceae bacterium]|nr:RNA polymerase sigma factor [Fimbriimonadaceae bacterium]
MSYPQASKLRADRAGALDIEDRLVREASQGSRASFDRLRGIHAPGMRMFLSGRVPEAQLDDVLQDVWIAAWSALPRFRHGSRFRTWLYAICFNKYRDYCRSARREPMMAELDERIVATDAQEHAGRLHTAENLRALMTRLSEEQREVLDLYYASEMNLREVASALDRNLNTVKYQFYRGLSNLERMLREQEVQEAAR